MAAFAEYQSQFAAHRIATFPVRIDESGKVPAISHYDKVGVRASAQLVLKFPDAEAFGFMAGTRSGITVLDIDARGREGEKLLARKEAEYGEARVVVRTGGGGFHGYYKSNHEPRVIRLAPKVDLLGRQVVVAPGSTSGLGQKYEVVRGTLDDLARLTKLRNLPLEQPERKVAVGTRNRELWRECMKQAPHCDDFPALLDKAQAIADNDFEAPMSEREIAKIAASAWKYQTEGRNWVGHGNGKNTLKALATADFDAYGLFSALRTFNGHRSEFIVAEAFGEKLGLPRKRFLAARAFLVSAGFIVKTRGGFAGSAASYRWGQEPSLP